MTGYTYNNDVYILFMVQFWICERLNLIKPTIEKAFPRFKKWRLKYIYDALTGQATKDITSSRVKSTPIKPTKIDKIFLNGELELHIDDNISNTEDMDVKSSAP